MTKDELNKIISDHGLWLADKSKGRRADLSGADLFGAYLCEAIMVETNLTEADLTRANLTRANLAGANLAGANLAGANLAGANLAGAYLTRANLSYTDLSEVNLFKTNMTGVNLTYATGQILFIGLIGSRRGTTYAYGYNGQIQINCGYFDGTLDEFEARVAREHGDTPDGLAYASAFNHIRAQAKAYDWFPSETQPEIRKEGDNE